MYQVLTVLADPTFQHPLPSPPPPAQHTRGMIENVSLFPEKADVGPAMAESPPTLAQHWASAGWPSPAVQIVRTRVSMLTFLDASRRGPYVVLWDPTATKHGGAAVAHRPASTKHFYSICTMLDQRRRLDRRCTNVIKMLCVCWAPETLAHG